MNINGFVAAAYAVFAAVLLWDYVAPRIRLGNIRRAIAARVRRGTGKKTTGTSTP